MIDATPRLSICLLGTPEIRTAGAPLALNHLKARALLFYLAGTGQSHTRDHLATLLWSEAGEDNAHHSLRTTMYRLRQALRPSHLDPLLVVEGKMLSLAPATYACDVAEFTYFIRMGDEEALTRAVSLYRGPLLQGFSLSDAPVFEEWVRAEDTRLSQLCFDALARLATWAETRQAWNMAVGYAQRMIQMDPLSETAQQRLMHLYLSQGEAGPALRQYRQFENLIQKELNLTPSTETRSLLHEALRLQRPRGGTATSTARSHSRILPFTGRERLLQQLAAIGQEAQAGIGRTVLLQGEAGIGKSRLLDEWTPRLTAGTPPWIVLQGACSPFDDLLIHGPFLEALQSGMTDDLTDLLSEPGSGVPDARGRFSWLVLQTIRSLARTAPLVLIIEDLQWANSSTLNLFGFLSMRLHHLPVLLVGTVQHAEAIPALRRLITLGRRRGKLHVFTLAPLTLGNVSTLLQSSIASLAAEESLAEWLHARSMGNPFLLTEILAQMRSEMILQPVEHGWDLDTIRWLRWRSTFTLPETAHDLVAWRLANIAPDARELLNVLAVGGQPVPVAVVRDLLGLQAGALLSLVDDLAARGLIIEPPNSTLALPHHLLRETLFHQLSELRRRTLHQQLAEALERHSSADKNANMRQIAIHAVAGEDTDRARRFGLRVLGELSKEYSGAETVDFVRHLYELLAPSASPDEMLQLTRALGMLHQSLGQLDTAGHWLQENLAWAQKIGNTIAQVEAYFELSELALMTNDYHAAAQAAGQGLSRFEGGDPSLHPSSPILQSIYGRGHRLLGAALAMEGSDLDLADSHLQEAVVAHRQTGNQGDLCAALFELGNVSAQRGELTRALDFYDEAIRAAETGHIHYYLALACNNSAYHSLLLGQIGAAQQYVAQGVKVAEAYDLLAALLHLYSTQGEIHLYLAEWKEAEECFRRGLTLAEDLGNLERQAGYRGGLALASRGGKDLDTGIKLLEEALALIAGQGYFHLRTRLELWLAELLFEEKRLAEASQTLEAATGIARAHQRKLLLVQGGRLHANLLAAGGDWSAANALFAETLEGASALGLLLEIARVQAAWGKAALLHSPAPEDGRAHLDAARAILVSHDARADLATLPEH